MYIKIEKTHCKFQTNKSKRKTIADSIFTENFGEIHWRVSEKWVFENVKSSQFSIKRPGKYWFMSFKNIPLKTGIFTSRNSRKPGHSEVKNRDCSDKIDGWQVWN